MKVFHGTSSLAWKKIQVEGWKCREDADWLLGKGVYFTLSEEAAWFYAKAAANRQGGEPLVLQTQVPDEVIWSTWGEGQWEVFSRHQPVIRAKFSGALVSIDYLGFTDTDQVIIWDEDLLKKLVLVPAETSQTGRESRSG